MSGHPIEDERLIAYAAGEVGGDAAAVASHLTVCPDCAATVARYRFVETTLRGDDSPPVPPATLARAKALFADLRRADVVETRPAAPPRDRRAPVRRVLAGLTFDSRAAFGSGLGFAGVRGGAGAAYRLAYESEAGEVDVQVEPPAGGDAEWRLLGQVAVDEATPGIRVALTVPGSEAPAAEVEADEQGVFAVAAMPGTYDLSIRLPAALLILPELAVG